MKDNLEELIDKIPDNFTINGEKYIVKSYPTLELDGEPRLGLTYLHRVDPEIQLALTLGGKDWPLSKATVLNTYYHELCHVLLTHAGIHDSELRVQSLANVLMQYEMNKEYLVNGGSESEKDRTKE